MGENLVLEHEKMESTTPSKDFLTLRIAGQLFGIPVLQVQDVLGEQEVTKVPLAPPEIAGSLNLRGRIVTAINVRKHLGLSNQEKNARTMGIVVEYEQELYNLIIDVVGDVLTLKNKNFENNPATLDPKWKSVAAGIYRLEKELLVVLDVPQLLESLSNHTE